MNNNTLILNELCKRSGMNVVNFIISKELRVA